MRVAVIDSSPLINFTHLELATKLSLYFEAIYVPASVQKEVNRKSRFRYRLKKLYRTGLFRKCEAADKVSVELLLHDLDEGEAEALTQAREKAARFFIGDEKRARQIGHNMGLTPAGTVRILARLHQEGHAAETRVLVRKLRKDLRYRVADALVDEAISNATQPI